jgi:hypothetical protein
MTIIDASDRFKKTPLPGSEKWAALHVPTEDPSDVRSRDLAGRARVAAPRFRQVLVPMPALATSSTKIDSGAVALVERRLSRML